MSEEKTWVRAGEDFCTNCREVRPFYRKMEEETVEEILAAQLGPRPLYIRTNESRIAPKDLKEEPEDDGWDSFGVDGDE